MTIRIVIRVPDGAIVPSIGSVVHQTQSYGRSGKGGVERPVNILSVVHVDISGMVIVESPTVIVDVHAAHTTHPIASITDIYIADLGNTPIIVVIDRHVLHLDYRPIIVILGIGTVIVT
jgi:alkyl sulfatase BDS1-like metallo-beta-lactamase superfamily hydrolase